MRTKLISGEDALQLELSLYVADFDLPAYEPDSGYADPTSAKNSFIGRTQEMGARLLHHTAVTGIRTQSVRIRQVQTDYRAIRTPVIMNAMGSWGTHAAAMVGIELPIWGWRHQIMYVQRPTKLAEFHPASIDDINTQSVPRLGNLSWLAWRMAANWWADPDNYRESMDPDHMSEPCERLTFRIPSIGEVGLVRGQAGCDGLTPDQHAIIDRVGPKGFCVVTGFSGRGFKLAPAVGLCVAELISQGSAETVDMAPLRLSRCARGKPLMGEHAYRRVWT